MRTLPTALQTVMDKGIFTPYIRLWVGPDYPSDPFIPISYKLEGTTLEATLPDGDFDASVIMIERGAVINGFPVTIKSDYYYAQIYTTEKGIVHIKANLFPNYYVTTMSDLTYSQIIDACLSITGSMAATYEGAPAWKNYKFYPAGQVAIFSPISQLITALKQKYFIFTVDDGFDGINSNVKFIAAGLNKYARYSNQDWTLNDPLFKVEYAQIYKNLMWKDETGTVHKSYGINNSLYHNLGYLESTAALPISDQYAACPSPDQTSSKVKVHLARQTGDVASITINNESGMIWGRVEIIEVFDPKETLSWHQIVKPAVFLSNTEGGSLPTEINNAVPFTSLMTGTFNGVLSSADNNIQQAFETLDDHTHNKTAFLNYITAQNNTEDIARIKYRIARIELALELLGIPVSEISITDVVQYLEA